MTTVDVEDLQTTKSEKLLSFVLTAFLLIGGVWGYQQLDDRVRGWVDRPQASAADRAAVERHTRAQQSVFLAQQRARTAENELVERRERYRTALEARDPAAPRLRSRYLAADRTLARARRSLAAARRAEAAAAPKAVRAQRRMAHLVQDELDEEDRDTFLARLALVGVSLAAGYWLLAWLRRRRSRYLPLGAATLAYATILAFVLAADYLTDYWDPFELGLIVLSLVGTAATVAAYWVLERYVARRLPRRRVRRSECPFCGFPVRGEHCEGCGREVVAPCAHSDAPRRVGTPHCVVCGAP